MISWPGGGGDQALVNSIICENEIILQHLCMRVSFLHHIFPGYNLYASPMSNQYELPTSSTKYTSLYKNPIHYTLMCQARSYRITKNQWGCIVTNVKPYQHEFCSTRTEIIWATVCNLVCSPANRYNLQPLA